MEIVLDQRKNKKSATELDRAMEKYALKLLNDEVEPEDRAEYERLLSARKRRLVKLQSARRQGQRRWFKTAS